jgi:trans-aconitate methyltransferase
MQSDIKASFSKAAQTYDKHAEFQYFAAQKLVNAIHETPNHILDIGCGTGILTELLRQKFPNARFTLLDISPAMLKASQVKLGMNNIDYICGSADDIALIGKIINKNKIDMLVSNLCFQWLGNPCHLIKTYQSYIPTHVSVLLDTSFYQWYESVKKICPNFKPPISLLPRDSVNNIHAYHTQYKTALDFLRSQKQLGTLNNIGNPLTVTQLKNACIFFETVYDARISYDLGIL